MDPTENPLPTVEKPTDETKPTTPKPTTPKKETKSKDAPSKSQQMKDLIRKKIDEGFPLNNKQDKIQLQKQILDELHLPKGSYSDAGKFLKDIMIEKKMQISDVGFKNDKIGDLTVNLVKSEEATPEIKSNVSQSPLSNIPQNTPNSSRGVLPKTQGSPNADTRQNESQEPEKEYMSESAQKKLISHGLTKVIFPLYTALGVVELDETEIKEESKIPKGKKVKQDFEELAGDIDEYLRENNIKLPALLNHLSIMISIFVVLVMPVIKFKFFSSKQAPDPTYDESASEVKVDA